MKAVPNTPVYSVCSGEIEGARESAMALWRGVIGSESELGPRYDKLWSNPIGDSILRFVKHEPSGDLVGIAAIGSREMTYRGNHYRAGVISHFSVSSAHRTLGPALTLIASLLSEASKSFDFVYGIPHSSEGARSVLRRAGLRPMGELKRYAKVLRYGPHLKKKMHRFLAFPLGWMVDAVVIAKEFLHLLLSPKMVIQSSRVFTDEMEGAWKTSSSDEMLTSVRSARFLGWRFGEGYAKTLEYLILRSGKDGRILAWFVCTSSEKWPEIFNVEDYWCVNGRDGMPAGYLYMLSALARRRGFFSLNLYVGGSPRIGESLLRAGFFERGSEKVFGIFTNDSLSGVDAADLHLTYIDQDG